MASLFSGVRKQVSALLVALAQEPDLFSLLVVHGGIRSLGYILEAPELFCLDLYKQSYLGRLTALAAPINGTVEIFLVTEEARILL
jgi:hypothetical protein